MSDGYSVDELYTALGIKPTHSSEQQEFLARNHSVNTEIKEVVLNEALMIRHELTPILKSQLESALSTLPSDDYNDWISVGMALKTLGEPARDLFVSWSSKSDKFDQSDIDRRWDGFSPTSIDHENIFWTAADKGWNPMSFLEDLSHECIDDEKKLGLYTLDINDLMTAEIPPPAFILTPLIPRGHTTLFGSDGGSGKSYLALAIAAHVAAGKSWANLETANGKVLFVSMEDDGQVVKFRLKCIVKEYELVDSLESIAAKLTIVDAASSSPLLQEDPFGRHVGCTKTYSAIKGLATGYDLVVIDNASDAFDADENSRRKVRFFIKQLTQIVKDHDGAVLLLAHVNKATARSGGSGTNYSGSTAWNNSARSRIALVDGSLTQEKLNLGRRMDPPIPIAWSNGVPVPDIDGTISAKNAEPLQALDDAFVLNAIKVELASGGTVPTANSGPNTAFHVLAARPELGNELCMKQNSRRVKQALARLQTQGLIRRASYKTRDRKEKEKWEIV